jgi:uncharacterized membrane protein
LHEFRKVYLLGLILGIILEVVGFASLVNYFANNSVFNYLLDGLGVVIVGIMFLAKSVPVFIPFKQQKADSMVCPNCGAILSGEFNCL